MNILVPIGLAIGLTTVALLIAIYELHVRSISSRVSEAVTGDAGQFDPVAGTSRWLTALGARYRSYYSLEGIEQLRSIAQTAGFNPHRMVPLLLGARTVSIVLFPMGALFFGEYSGGSFRDIVSYVAVGAAIGILGPQWLLSYIRRRFTAAVTRGMPDAIDLLVVCSEAGLGLESALQRVVDEMQRSNPPVAKILAGLLNDLRILPNRQDAFTNLAKRSVTNGVRRFGTMINQSMHYGTPLSDTLRALADELRRERLIKLEERAHKLAAKLIVPMVVFMLPAMFVTLGGSSFLHLVHAFDGLGK